MLEVDPKKIAQLLLQEEFNSTYADEIAQNLIEAIKQDNFEETFKKLVEELDSEVENLTESSLYALSSVKLDKINQLSKNLRVLRLSTIRIQRHIVAEKNKYSPGDELFEKYSYALEKVRDFSNYEKKLNYYIKPYFPPTEAIYYQLLTIGVDAAFLQKIDADWLNGTIQNKIVEKFDDFGKIAEDEVAMALDIKKQSRAKKNQDFHAFAINHTDIPEVVKIINENLHTKVPIRFQVAIKVGGEVDVADGHWAAGEFIITPTPGRPEVKMLLCDSLGAGISIGTYEKFKESPQYQELSKNADVKMYMSNDLLQTRPKGCSYFAIDTVSQLSTQENYEDIYKYMEKNGTNNNGIIVSSLPARLLRMEQSMTSLNKKVPEEARGVIVNKKGQTFKQSLKQNTEKSQSKNPNTGEFEKRKFNVRNLNKRKKLQRSVSEYLKAVPDAKAYRNIVFDRRISGLRSYISSLEIDPLMQHATDRSMTQRKSLVFRKETAEPAIQSPPQVSTPSSERTIKPKSS